MTNKKMIDLHGKVFFRWTVISYAGKKWNSTNIWKCKCVCGNIKDVASENLTSGKSTSCGCFKIEKTKISNKKHGATVNYHRPTEYNAWASMIGRCTNIKNKRFDYYGGRGIKICDRWLNSFENFLEDMGKKPTPKHSLDRYPNNNGNYEKSNCRWATHIEQCRNRRSNKWFEYDNKNMLLTDWAKHFNVNQNVLSVYIKKHSFVEAYNYYMK